MAVQPGLRQRLHDQRDHLGVALGAAHPDQLDPALEELARLAAAALDRAVGVGEVAEPQGPGLGRIAVRHQPRDRDRGVRAQRQDVPAVVEQAEAGRGALVAAAKHLLVLERGRPDLAEPGAIEGRVQAPGERAKLAHLVGQHVARAGRNRVNHAGLRRRLDAHLDGERFRRHALDVRAELL